MIDKKSFAWCPNAALPRAAFLYKYKKILSQNSRPVHTDTIVRLCPAEKLVGCQYDDDGSDGSARTNKSAKVKTEDEIYDELARIAQGIFLSIDNNLLSSCQKAVQNKVLEVCGSLSECDAFDEDNVIGTDSLVTYRNGDQIVIDGLMNFGLLKSKEETKNNKITYSIDDSEFKFTDEVWTTIDTSTIERIKAAIQTVETRVTQQIDALSTDPTIDMCINGRSGNWRYSRTGKQDNSQDKFQRFPNLLDSYAKMVFNSGLKRAYLNYRTKYDEMVGKALEEQSDDIKSAVCAAMAYQKGHPVCVDYRASLTGSPVCKKYDANKDLENIFGNTGSTGLQNNGTQYVIQGADLGEKLQAMSQAKGEFIQTDGKGNMIGSISITSTYSPGTNICTVTTTTTMCSDIDMAVTTDTYNCGGGSIVGIGGGCGQGGINVVGGYGETTTTQNYHGVYCTSYGEPVISTTEIKM